MLPHEPENFPMWWLASGSWVVGFTPCHLDNSICYGLRYSDLQTECIQIIDDLRRNTSGLLNPFLKQMVYSCRIRSIFFIVMQLKINMIGTGV